MAPFDDEACQAGELADHLDEGFDLPRAPGRAWSRTAWAVPEQ